MEEWLLREPLLEDGQPSNGSQIYRREQPFSESLRAVHLIIHEDVEYMRRRTAMLLSQVQQMRDRAQSQTSFVSDS